MATKTKKAAPKAAPKFPTGEVKVTPSNLICLQTLNYRVDKAVQFEKLVASMVKIGYDDSLPANTLIGMNLSSIPTGFTVGGRVIKTADELLDYYVTCREREYKDLLDARETAGTKKQPMAIARVEAFQRLYMDDGKIYRPPVEQAVLPIMGHQRSKAILEAVATLIKGHEYKDDAITDDWTVGTTVIDPESVDMAMFNVPVKIVTFKTFQELKDRQYDENERRAIGQSKTTDLDQQNMANQLLAAGATQKDIRRRAGATNPSKGIKQYYVYRLNEVCPDMNLMRRLFAKKGDDGKYPEDRIEYRSIDGSKLAKLTASATDAGVKAWNDKIRRANQDVGDDKLGDKLITKLTAEQIEKAMLSRSKPTTLSKSVWQAYVPGTETLGHLNLLVRKIAEDHLNNEQDAFVTGTHLAEGHNAVYAAYNDLGWDADPIEPNRPVGKFGEFCDSLKKLVASGEYDKFAKWVARLS